MSYSKKQMSEVITALGVEHGFSVEEGMSVVSDLLRVSGKVEKPRVPLPWCGEVKDVEMVGGAWVSRGSARSAQGAL